MSAVITPFEGTELFNTASFNNRISQINTGFSYVSNSNLLDNWYFQIWQRYQDGNYSGVPNNSYVSDRWLLTSSNGDIISNLTKATSYGGIKNANGPNCRITQRLENAAQYNGMTLTLSTLKNTGLFTFTKVASGWTDTTDIFAGFSATVAWLNTGETIIAAKLELGSTQTLAHQENGAWVLNEVPDYGEQLRRCQRYYYRLKADSGYMRFGITQPYTDTSAGVFVQLMSTMRTKPVVSYGGNFTLFDGARFFPVTLAQDTTSAYNTVLKANGTGLPGSSAQLLANADTNAYIDFSADL